MGTTATRLRVAVSADTATFGTFKVMTTPEREAELAAAYETAMREMTLLLRDWDPEGFEASGCPPDEYEWAAAHLLPRVARASEQGTHAVRVELAKMYESVAESQVQQAVVIVAPLTARPSGESR